MELPAVRVPSASDLSSSWQGLVCVHLNPVHMQADNPHQSNNLQQFHGGLGAASANKNSLGAAPQGHTIPPGDPCNMLAIAAERGKRICQQPFW